MCTHQRLRRQFAVGYLVLHARVGGQWTSRQSRGFNRARSTDD
jgi:hypothetical protein